MERSKQGKREAKMRPQKVSLLEEGKKMLPAPVVDSKRLRRLEVEAKYVLALVAAQHVYVQVHVQWACATARDEWRKPLGPCERADVN